MLMARTAAEIVSVLFEDVMKPLVLGGTLVARRPLGEKLAHAVSALALQTGSLGLLGAEQLSLFQLGRVQALRMLLPIDRLPPPSPAEWALAVLFHDIVQCTHPEMAKGLFGKPVAKLLPHLEQSLARVPAPRSVMEVLGRHSLFGRMFEVRRTDTELHWWTGKATFLGREPPARLTAWPELRRVVRAAERKSIPELAPKTFETSFESCVYAFLDTTPLTDFATCTRASPPFRFTPRNSVLLEHAPSRKLVLRVLKAQDPARLKTVLGDHALAGELGLQTA
jgi:hypothetical protein